MTPEYIKVMSHILKENPSLGYAGFGLNRRDEMLTAKAEIEFRLATMWIRARGITKACKSSRYNLKHQIQRDSGVYISNGVVIAAAIYLGAPFKWPRADRSQNADLGVRTLPHQMKPEPVLELDILSAVNQKELTK